MLARRRCSVEHGTLFCFLQFDQIVEFLQNLPIQRVDAGGEHFGDAFGIKRQRERNRVESGRFKLLVETRNVREYLLAGFRDAHGHQPVARLGENLALLLESGFFLIHLADVAVQADTANRHHAFELCAFHFRSEFHFGAGDLDLFEQVFPIPGTDDPIRDQGGRQQRQYDAETEPQACAYT